MPDRHQEGKPLDDWFIGGGDPPAGGGTPVPPPLPQAAPAPPPFDPEPPEPSPPPLPRSGPPAWARTAVLAAALVSFGGAGAYLFYPRHVTPNPVPTPAPEPGPKAPEPAPLPAPEPAPDPKPPDPLPTREPPPPIVVEPKPSYRAEPKKQPAGSGVLPPVERVDPAPVQPPPVVVEPPRKEEPPPPVRRVDPPVTVVPDPGSQPPPRNRLPRPDSSTIVRPPPAVYSGPPSGVINWSGRLAKDGALVIDGNSTQEGVLNGSLPGVPVMIDIDTKEFAIAEAPSPSNGWKRLVIRSRRKTHSVVSIRWTVMQQ